MLAGGCKAAHVLGATAVVLQKENDGVVEAYLACFNSAMMRPMPWSMLSIMAA